MRHFTHSMIKVSKGTQDWSAQETQSREHKVQFNSWKKIIRGSVNVRDTEHAYTRTFGQKSHGKYYTQGKDIMHKKNCLRDKDKSWSITLSRRLSLLPAVVDSCRNLQWSLIIFKSKRTWLPLQSWMDQIFPRKEQSCSNLGKTGVANMHLPSSTMMRCERKEEGEQTHFFRTRTRTFCNFLPK